MASGNEYPAGLAMGTTMLDTATPGNLPDVLRNLAMSDGTTKTFAAVLNQLLDDMNTLKGLAAGPVAASQTVTLGGTWQSAQVLNVTIGGTEVSYTTVTGDATLAGSATSLAAAINADTSVNTLVKAAASTDTVTITAITAGTGFNGTTLAVSVGAGTITLTAGAATFAGGVGPIQQPSVAAGSNGSV